MKVREMSPDYESIPVLSMGAGCNKSLNICDPNDANGVGLVVSELDTSNNLNPYFMMYFTDWDSVTKVIDILVSIRERLQCKLSEVK